MRQTLFDFFDNDETTQEVAANFRLDAEAVIYHGDCLKGLQAVPDEAIKLIITSPPYNIGKTYEDATQLDTYLEALSPILDELIRVLSPAGSLC